MNVRLHRPNLRAFAASAARRATRALAPVSTLALRRHDRGTLACLGSAR